MNYPKNHKDSLIFRAKLLARCANDPEYREKVKALFFKDILFAFNAFFYTLDVRRRPEHNRCFCTYPYQDETILDIYNTINNKPEDIIVEKSRDMGCSWILILIYLYCWLNPEGGGDFLLGSRVADYVDTKGDMRSLFEKARYVLYKLPNWIRPEGFLRNKHDFFRRLINPETGATLTGESNNPNFSTGGRYTGILFDEFAKWELTDESAWTAAGDATPCRIAISTPFGASGKYYKLATDGKTKKIILHWSKHPLKNKGLYCKYPKPLGAGDIVDGKHWIGLGSEWYDDECKRRTPIEVAQELDINYIGSGYPFFSGRSMGRIQFLLKSPREPKRILGLEYGSLKLTESETKEDALLVFEEPQKEFQYIISVDVAEGKDGGDYSIIKVLNRFTLSTDATFHTQLDEVQLSKYVVAITKYYTFEGQDEPWWAVEANSLGLSVFDFCTEIYDLPNPFMMPRYDTVKQAVSYRKGWWTSSESRRALVSGITKWLLDGTGWTDPRCIGEMLTFVKDKNGKPAAKEGTHDDEVMCFGIGLQVHNLVPFVDEKGMDISEIFAKKQQLKKDIVRKQAFNEIKEETLEERCINTALKNKDIDTNLIFQESVLDYYSGF